MENEIVAVIITKTRIHYPITEAQHQALARRISIGELSSQIMVDGQVCEIFHSNVGDIVGMKKYYEAFPDKRPPMIDRYKNTPGMGMSGIIIASREKMLRGIITGLKKYINSEKYQGTQGPIELLKIAENRLATL